MKRPSVTSYEYKEGLSEQVRHEMTAAYAEHGAGEGIIAQHQRLFG